MAAACDTDMVVSGDQITDDNIEANETNNKAILGILSTSIFSFIDQKDEAVTYEDVTDSDIHQAVNHFRKIHEKGLQSADVERNMSDRVLTSFFRETVLTMAATRSRDDKKRFLELCAILLAMDVLPASTVMFVAQDCLATSTIFECELLFSFLEDNMRFFGSCKNTLLIVCTGLIARLSTVLNAGFRGRILLFLARFYPLTDKSGANVIGAFNTDLNFGDVEAELEEEKSRTSTPQVLGTADPMDTDETVETSTKSVPGASEYMPIDSTGCLGDVTGQGATDFDLFRKYSKLQMFCQKPQLIFDESGQAFKDFLGCVNTLATTFEGDRLGDKKAHEMGVGPELVDNGKALVEGMSIDEASESYNPKFTTSPRLIGLQLTDPNFRLMVLQEALIIFHHLLLPEDKFRKKENVLTDEQVESIYQATTRVYTIMKDTPPTGVYVARCMRRVLDNELYWVEWKNKACPATSFQPDSISQLPLPPPLPNQQPNPASNKRRFTPGETVSSKAILGSCTAKVDQIWETFKSNTTCKSSNDTNNHIDYFTGVPQEKIFLDFVEEAVEQCDPIAEIDMEYRIVNEDWWWRLATRICQRHSVKYKYKLSEIIGNSKAAMVQLLESMWKERNPEKVKQMAEEAAKAKAMKDKQLAELAAEEEKERLALEEAEKANKKAADEKLKQEQLKARLQEDKAKKDEAKAKLKEEAEIAKLENADENLKKETDTGKAGPGPDTLVSRRSSGAIKRESSIESGEESSNSQYGGGQSKTTISEYTKKPVSANTNTTSGTKRKADSNRIDSNSTMRSESDAKKLKADNGEARRKSIKGTDDLYKDAEIRAKDSDYKRSKESDREKSKDRRTNASDSRPTSRPSSRPASRRASSDRYSSDNTIGKTKDGDGSTFNSKGLGRNGANDDSIGVVQSQGAKNIRTKVKATERVRSSPSQTTITSASDSNHKLGSTGRTSSCASLGGESTGEKSDKYDNHDRSQSVGNRANSGNSVSMQHGTGISSMNSSSKSDATKAPPKSHIRKAESIGVRQASITARDTYAGVKHSTDSGSGEVDTEANQTQQKSNSRSNAQTPNGRMRNAAGGGSGGPGLVQRQLSDVMQQRQNRFQPQGKGSGSNVGSPVQSRGHLGEGNTNGRTHNTNQNDRGNANNSNNTSRRSSGVGSHSGKRDMRDGGTPERKKSKHY